MVRLLTERSDTRSNVKLGGFRSQLQASYVSSHTEELWYNKTVCMWRTIYIYIYTIVGWKVHKMMIISAFDGFFYHCNTDGRSVWATRKTRLKNKPHLATFSKSIMICLWTFKLNLVYFLWFDLVCWVLWHINLCRLFNAKSIFM